MGAAVGGVIVVFEAYRNPPAQASQIEDLKKYIEEKFDSEIEKVKNELLNDGLKTQEIKNSFTEGVK